MQIGSAPTAGRVIALARHVETAKNLANVHGRSSLTALTPKGEVQARRLSDQVTRQTGVRLDGVWATSTAQAVGSAKLVADLAGLPYLGELGLAPVDIGIAAGLSSDELRRAHPAAFRSLDLFRARAVSGSELTLPGAETAAVLASRLSRWWAAEGAAQCPNRLVVGSSSTVLMLAHHLNGVSPLMPGYRYLPTPNGSLRIWHDEGDGWRAGQPFPRRLWPEVDIRHLRSANGSSVAISHHWPSWVAKDRAIVIVPGYFGSSRHGPYGLYSRLARTWAWAGHPSVTVDPLGSGDSSPVYRDFDSEVESIEVASRWMLRQSSSLLLVGHSMGSATALEARARLPGIDCQVWCLAPLCRMTDLSRAFFDAQQLAELLRSGRTTRHGLELRQDMIDGAERAWEQEAHSADRIWLADADPYARDVDLPIHASDRIHVIAGADHNFSTNDSADSLTRSTVDTLESENALY